MSIPGQFLTAWAINRALDPDNYTQLERWVLTDVNGGMKIPKNGGLKFPTLDKASSIQKEVPHANYGGRLYNINAICILMDLHQRDKVLDRVDRNNTQF